MDVIFNYSGIAMTLGPYPGWEFGACAEFGNNKCLRNQGSTRVLAIDSRGIGQHVPGTISAKVVLMFSQHVKTVPEEDRWQYWHRLS